MGDCVTFINKRLCSDNNKPAAEAEAEAAAVPAILVGEALLRRHRFSTNLFSTNSFTHYQKSVKLLTAVEKSFHFLGGGASSGVSIRIDPKVNSYTPIGELQFFSSSDSKFSLPLIVSPSIFQS